MVGHGIGRRTALITGAAGGLGSKLASRLAREGFDLILVDREIEGARRLALNLSGNTGVTAHALAQDLTEPDSDAKVLAACGALGCNVDVLVNNAAYALNKPLHELPWSAIRDHIRLLLRAPVQLCHLFLPQMIDRGWGRIINIASVSGFMPGSIRVATYTSSKAFLIPFSEALSVELAGTGVCVSAICPGFMKTGIFASSGLADVRDSVPAFLWLNTEQVADEAVNAAMKGIPVRVNGLSNRLIVTASKFLPRALLRERSRIFHAQARRARPRNSPSDAPARGTLAALVTGATAGIGASLCDVLARKGYDLVLVARRAELLQRRAEEIAARYNVRTHTIVQDLAEPIAAEVIAGECERLGWPIDVLVNNAASPVTELFHLMSGRDIDAALNVLVTSVVEMSHRFAVKMLPRRRGIVINVASVAALQPGTYRSSLYTSSKAFVLAFSESLAADLEGTGVTVTALCPGFTRTEWFAKIALKNNPVPDFLWMDSDEVAEAGFRAAERGAVVAVVGTLPLRALYGLFRIAPRRLIGAMLSKKRKDVSI